MRIAQRCICLLLIGVITPGRAESQDRIATNREGAVSDKTLESSASVKMTRDARGRKIHHIDFDEAVIEGKAKTPDGFMIQSRAHGKFKSLIELRSDFRDNIKINALETISPSGINN